MSSPDLSEIKSIRSFPLKGTLNPLVVTQYQNCSIQVHIPDNVKDQAQARDVVARMFDVETTKTDAGQYSVLTAHYDGKPEQTEAVFDKLISTFEKEPALDDFLANEKSTRDIPFGKNGSSNINIEYDPKTSRTHLSVFFDKNDAASSYADVRQQFSPEVLAVAIPGAKVEENVENRGGTKPYFSVEIDAVPGTAPRTLYTALVGLAEQTAQSLPAKSGTPWVGGATQMGSTLSPEQQRELVASVMSYDGKSEFAVRPVEAEFLRQLRGQLVKPGIVRAMG
jgi:hypothetical protein